MNDLGGEIALRVLAATKEQAPMRVDYVIKCNRQRQDITQKCIDEIPEDIISSRPIVYFNKNIPMGIIGLVAGYLCEREKCPVIVFTQDSEGILKGSGRSIEGIHLKNALDKCADLLVAYGGHEGAAGLSVTEENLTAFTNAFQKACGNIPPKTQYICYDLDITPAEVPHIKHVLDKFAPFGEGNPMPVFCIHSDIGDPYYMGTNGEHVKYRLRNIDLVGFHMIDHVKEGSQITAIGKISENWYQEQCSLQLLMDDFSIA